MKHDRSTEGDEPKEQYIELSMEVVRSSTLRDDCTILANARVKHEGREAKEVWSILGTYDGANYAADHNWKDLLERDMSTIMDAMRKGNHLFRWLARDIIRMTVDCQATQLEAMSRTGGEGER